MRILVRAQEKTSSEQKVGSCQIDSLRKLGEETEYRDGFFLMFSQPKRGYCGAMRRVLDSTVKNLKPIVEASLSDEECVKLADSFNVEITPTVLYLKKSEEKKRIAPDGKITWHDVEAKISSLAAQTS